MTNERPIVQISLTLFLPGDVNPERISEELALKPAKVRSQKYKRGVKELVEGEPYFWMFRLKSSESATRAVSNFIELHFTKLQKVKSLGCDNIRLGVLIMGCDQTNGAEIWFEPSLLALLADVKIQLNVEFIE